MGVCGYNEPIGKSMETFATGMVEAMNERSISQKKEITKLIDEEIRELREIISHLSGREEDSIYNLISGLDTFALAYFQIIKSQMNDGRSFEEACHTTAHSLNNALAKIDDYHKSIRNSSNDIPTELANWVANQKF